MVKKQRTLFNFLLRPNENNIRRFSLWSDFAIVSGVLTLIILSLKFYWVDFIPLFKKVSNIVYNTDVGEIKDQINAKIESEFSGVNKKMDTIGLDISTKMNNIGSGINNNIDQQFSAMRAMPE